MTQYQAVFTFNRNLPEAYQKLVIEDFTSLYNMAVEELNKHYEMWNNEFDMDMNLPGAEELYNKFITKHQREVLEPINNRAERNPFRFTILDVDGEGNLFGRLKAVHDITIMLTLKPIEIEA